MYGKDIPQVMIDALTRRCAELQEQIEQMTMRRADALKIIEAVD